MRRASIRYLYRRGDRFYFRAAIPKSLRKRLDWQEIKVALRTDDPRVARSLCVYLGNRLESFLRQTERMSHLTVKHVQDFARQYFQDCLNEAYALVDDVSHDAEIDADFEIAGSKEDTKELRDSLRKRQYSRHVERQAHELIDRFKPSGARVSPDILAATCEMVARAEIDKHRYLIAMLSGNPEASAPADPLFVGMMPTDFPSIDVPSLDNSEGKPNHTLDAIANDFILKRGKTIWVEKTEADYRRVLTWAKEIIGGSRHLSSVTTQDVKAFRDALARLPANFVKLREFEGKTLSDVVIMQHDAGTISVKTQDKYYSMFRSFLKWCLEEELIDKMPGMGVKVIGAAKGNDTGDRVFSKAQLSAIFASPLFQGCRSPLRRGDPGNEEIRDAYYWIPVVAHLTGMRLGEIVQLHLDDVREADGIVYFDINKSEDGQKRLKTRTSARKVPLPEPMLALGFMEFVDQRLKVKGSRLFREVKCGADGYYSHNFSKWWGRYARKIKAHKPRTSFHSFRHNFKDAIAASEAPEMVTKALMGHSDRSVHASYGSGPSLERLKQAIDCARHQVDIVAMLGR